MTFESALIALCELSDLHNRTMKIDCSRQVWPGHTDTQTDGRTLAFLELLSEPKIYLFVIKIFLFVGLERNFSPGLTPSHSVKRKPLLFLTPSVNLAQSIEVDTSLPLENQE